MCPCAKHNQIQISKFLFSKEAPCLMQGIMQHMQKKQKIHTVAETTSRPFHRCNRLSRIYTNRRLRSSHKLFTFLFSNPRFTQSKLFMTIKFFAQKFHGRISPRGEFFFPLQLCNTKCNGKGIYYLEVRSFHVNFPIY